MGGVVKDVLSGIQTAVTNRVLGQESAVRRHLVVSLSGAHAYGFPSPDSDLDLKAIHIESTPRLLSLSPPSLHFDRMEVIDGVEVDYTSNELHPVLVGILGGNGNYIERVLGALALRSSPEHEELRPVVERSLSRRVYRHYHGFASGQLRGFENAAVPTAKKVLYVLRTALTGVHLLRTGELVTDVTRHLDEHGFATARELVDRKRAGERAELDVATRERWLREVGRAFALLDDARDHSPLPEDSANRAEVDSWLKSVRRRFD